MVVAQLEPGVLDDQETGGDAEGQAEDIYKGEDFVFEEVSECDSEEVADHSYPVCELKRR
jgi:hypothetical protein